MKKVNFKDKRTIVAIIGMGVGIITVVLGIVLSEPHVSTVTSKYFGADFYTEMHSAVSYICWNIEDLIHLVFYASKCMLISIGLFEIVFFLYKFISVVENSEENKSNKTEYEEVKEIESELPEI
jgi:hypothetical protein